MENFRMIFKLKEMIKTLDALIFKNFSIPCKIVTHGVDTLATYSVSKDQQECYLIRKCSDKELERVFISRHTSSIDKFLLETATHEIRHRIQHRLQVNLFWDFPFIEIKDADLKSAVEETKRFFRKINLKGIFLPLAGQREAKEEFDAMVISKYASRKWKGNNYEEVAQLLLCDFKSLWGENENDLPNFLISIENQLEIKANYYDYP